MECSPLNSDQIAFFLGIHCDDTGSSCSGDSTVKSNPLHSTPLNQKSSFHHPSRHSLLSVCHLHRPLSLTYNPHAQKTPIYASSPATPIHMVVVRVGRRALHPYTQQTSQVPRGARIGGGAWAPGTGPINRGQGGLWLLSPIYRQRRAERFCFPRFVGSVGWGLVYPLFPFLVPWAPCSTGDGFFLALVSILAFSRAGKGKRGHEVIMCALKRREEGARADYRIFGDLVR